MKVRILLYSLVCFVSCTWLSCTEDGNGLAYETDTALIIQFNGEESGFSRAISDQEKLFDTQVHDLHVFIFDSEGNIIPKEDGGYCYWHFSQDDFNQSGSVTLLEGNWKTVFADYEECDVYVVANLYKPVDDPDQMSDFSFVEDLTAVQTLNDLKELTDQNHQIFQPVSDIKKLFTMSGCIEKWEPLSSPNTCTLSVLLTRLAARIEVNVEINYQSDEIEAGYVVGNPQFELINYATKALVLSGSDDTFTDREWASEDDLGGNLSTESANQYVTYTYPNEWNADILHETYVLIDVPLTKNDETIDIKHNYYKVPLRLATDDKKLERNHWYKIKAKISSKGNIVPDNPVELTDVQYKVAEWKDMWIEVGNDNPMYLELSEYEVVMRNVDTYDLTFASSSNIQSAEIKDVYFINKNGDPISVTNKEINATYESGLNGTLTIHSPVPENKTIRYMKLTVKNEQKLTKTVIIMQYPLEYITGIAGLYSYLNEYTGSWPEYNGELFSHLNYSGGTPHYEFNDEIQSEIIHGFTNLNIEGLDGNIGTKAVMKSKFYVKNSSGGRIFRIDYDYFDSYNYVQTSFSANKTVYVRKYKLEDNKSDNDILVPGNEKKKYILTPNTSDNGKYILENDEYIRVQDGTGTYEITYEVSQNQGTFIDVYGIETEYKENYIYYSVDNNIEPYLSDNNTASNNRMYHVVITSTSDGYQLARPPMTSEDENATVVQNSVNNTFVSPSFMLASQLGNSSVLSWSDAEKQCQNYVEVGMNGEEYNDWRLPTLEEIRIIKKYQEETPDVMDVVLETRETNENNENANPYYWTAIEDVYIYTGNATAGTPEDNKCRVRCVRDFHIGEPTE